MQGFFGELDNTLKIYSIDPKDFYTADESGFINGMANKQKEAINDPTHLSYIASTTNKNYVLVVKCMSNKSDVLPPFVILPE